MKIGILGTGHIGKTLVRKLRTDAGISDPFGSSTLKASHPVHSSKLHHLFSRLS
jgi:predicted dinucleotide-binding enzyme